MDIEARAVAQGRIRDLVRQLDGTSFGVALRSPDARHRRAYEALLQNRDPVMREIGEQLRDGRIRLSDVIRIPAYAEAFHDAASRAADRLDPVVVAQRLEELAAEQRDEGGREDP